MLELSGRSARAESIVADTIQLITEEGYGAFSLRRVAAKNGIKLASLQYHFKTKEALFDAVLERVMSGFEERLSLDNPALSSALTPEKLLEAMIDYVVSGIQVAEASGFFFQLWAVSCHDASAARVQEGIYAHYRNLILIVIEKLNPALSASQRNVRSVVIVSMLEGLMLFISAGKSQRQNAAKIAEEIRKDVLLIIMAE